LKQRTTYIIAYTKVLKRCKY